MRGSFIIQFPKKRNRRPQVLILAGGSLREAGGCLLFLSQFLRFYSFPDPQRRFGSLCMGQFLCEYKPLMMGCGGLSLLIDSRQRTWLLWVLILQEHSFLRSVSFSMLIVPFLSAPSASPPAEQTVSHFKLLNLLHFISIQIKVQSCEVFFHVFDMCRLWDILQQTTGWKTSRLAIKSTDFNC